MDSHKSIRNGSTGCKEKLRDTNYIGIGPCKSKKPWKTV